MQVLASNAYIVIKYVTERKREIPYWLNHVRNIRFNSNCHIMRGAMKTGLLIGRV